MNKSNDKLTILYARLSQEDEKIGVSNSIENQRMMLEKYAEDHGFENVVFLADDGWSGTNFNRPSWKKVMEHIENNRVGILIVKDSSRLGRDYLYTGQLMEVIFPDRNIRFISIGDQLDTLYGYDDFMPFKNLFHDYQAKEGSKKVRAVKKAAAERGERIGTRAPYGYKKREDDPKKIEPDPIVSDVIREIFKLCIDGLGPTQIARELEKRQRVNPSNHYYNQTGVMLHNLDITTPNKWCADIVARILADEIYLGHTISMRYTNKSYKNKKKIERPKEEWLRFENTHIPLISQDDFEIAGRVRETKKRPRKNMDTPNMFSGLTFCSECDKYMVIHRARTMDEKKNNFTCSTYKKYGKDKCSSHYIRETQLAIMVLDDLKRVSHFARMKQKEFAEYISKKSTVQVRKAITKLTKELDDLKHRNTELDSLFKRLYEDNVLGKIPDEVFRKLSDDYLIEQKNVNLQLPQMENQLATLKNSLTNADKFIARAIKYGEITELTSEILRNFITKIVVHEKTERHARGSNQKIEIHYLDIGYLGDYTEESDIAEPQYDFEMSKNGELIAV